MAAKPRRELTTQQISLTSFSSGQLQDWESSSEDVTRPGQQGAQPSKREVSCPGHSQVLQKGSARGGATASAGSVSGEALWTFEASMSWSEIMPQNHTLVGGVTQ